eukprot:TRINITY_DN66127_c2_g11_i1.p1 TRINITY_DN66127_c2_g11~~TRINITY_DN66127_c2_g11_i1.p1  ORF type:complete len:367 (-),score=156.42 TRINITY_DN66127_c2_g11_i1:67-1101(-)
MNVPLACGHHSLQGRRPTMEDRHTLLLHPALYQECKVECDDSKDDGQSASAASSKSSKRKGKSKKKGGKRDGNVLRKSAAFMSVNRSFFAVFDGHGGHVSAEYCRRHVHQNIVKDQNFGIDSVQAVANGLLQTENNFLAAARKLNLTTSSGTCVICALFEGDQLIIGNVGDSRAVLCRGKKAVPLSDDHKPDRPDERRRVETLGGAVARSEQEAFNKDLCTSLCNCLCSCLATAPMRVYPGGLAVSRTIGDIGLKATKLISAEPEMRTHTIEPGRDKFLILACDGVWDVFSSQQAVDIVLAELKKHRSATDAAMALAEKAYDKGSTDNISSVVIVIDPQRMYSS